MKRRSFLAAASAAAGCSALGIKAIATPVKLLPSEYSAPYDVMWDGAKWITDPFIKIELGMDGFSAFTLMTSHGDLQFDVISDRTCRIKDTKNSYLNYIPLTLKEFNKGEFYAESIRIYSYHKISFYEIHNRVVRDGEITTYSNLYAAIEMKSDLFISQEAIEEIQNWSS
jgi:hypothetical protein